MEFAEVRVYQPGDDVRSIDWRVTARRQKPHTKLFHEERERPVFLLCDQSLPMFFGSRRCFKSVMAADIAALLAWIALSSGDRVGGVVFSDQRHHPIKPARSRKTALALLRTITEFNHALSVGQSVQPVISLNHALRELQRLTKHGALICLISDFSGLNDESDKHIHELARHNELIAFQVFDPLEKELPPPGVYPISDGQTVSWLNTRDKGFRANYRGTVEARDARLRALCLKHHAPLIPVSTQDDIVRILQQFTSAAR